ncbi:MAG: hypothetical protein IPN77_26810 [Sandaracinaceae bacterium]|nr:hypothetical protein [Sandaracinaceae bacterium]
MLTSLPAPTLTLGMVPVRILGSGVAFPPHAETTAELLGRLAPEVPAPRRDALARHFDADIGVLRRAHLTQGRAVDLAVTAARAALEDSHTPRPIAVLVATSTPSRWTAAESAILARELGLACAFFDVRSGCTGGLHALVQGARLARDAGGPVLVVGADAFSLAFGPERLLPVSMGDGAGALVLGPSGDATVGITRAVFGGAPSLVDLATVPDLLPPSADVMARDVESRFRLDGDPEAFSEAAEAALGIALDALLAGVLSSSDQPTALVVQTGRASCARRVAARAGHEPYLGVLENHGNLGAGTLLVALHALSRSPEISRVLLVSAGGGLSFGAASLRMRP